MGNRFFDIDNNVYLNGLYVVALIGMDEKTYKLGELNLKLFLIKNPYVFLNLCNNLAVQVNKDIFEQFQYCNLQAEMSKYILKVQVKGLLETLNFLYSKGLVQINYSKDMIQANVKCVELYQNEIPYKIKLVSNEINKLFDKVLIKDIKKALFLEGDNLYE